MQYFLKGVFLVVESYVTFSQTFLQRTCQHLLGTRAGTIDRGSQFFSREKGGEDFFSQKKNQGEEILIREEQRGPGFSLGKNKRIEECRGIRLL